jgi:hypothetical protein
MSAPSNSGHQNSLWSEFFNSLSQEEKSEPLSHSVRYRSPKWQKGR